MSQLNHMNIMKVKVILGQDIRRWRYSSQSTLSSLNEFVATSFNLSNFWLQYEDDEGDRLTLSSQNDFEDAFTCAQEEDRKSLKIYVIHGSIHNAQHSKDSNPSSPPNTESESQSMPSCLEIKQAAIDFLQNPTITKLLPDLHRRIFEEINKRKALQESAEYKSSEKIPKWDSPQSVEQIMRDILQNETKFAPITTHDLYNKKLSTMIPCFAVKISYYLPILMNFSSDAIASWIPHLAAVIGGGLNTFVSSTDAMSSFFPLMCSFMKQHGDYSSFDENGSVIHHGVQCDECSMMPIKGARFKCIVCSNYDVCGQCESLSKHDNNHPLIKFTLNARNASPPFMGLHEIMTQFGHGPHHWFGHLWKPQRARRHCGKPNQQAGFQPHPHHHPAPHHWWNHQDGDHWNNRGNRDWKRCNRYGNQWNSFEAHHAQNPWNEWCVNRQQDMHASDASSAVSSNISGAENKVKNKNKNKIKVMADFVCDVTLQDRTYYPTDTVLTKTWKMKNNGDHEWGKHVELVFFKGNEGLTLEKRYPVINAKPGQEVEVSAVIKTPTKAGRYCSYYRLQRNGEYFGPRVWVDIFAVDEQQKNNKQYNNNNNKWQQNNKQKQNKNKKVKKQMKSEKKEAKLEAKQMRLEAKQNRLASKLENVSAQLDDQKENEDSSKLMKKQAKLEKQQKHIKKRVEVLQNKQGNLKKVEVSPIIDEEQLLHDIVNAAVKDFEATLSNITCVCGTVLDKTSPIEAYKGSMQVNCDICGKFAASTQEIYHCPNEKSTAHPEGYDLCCNCAEYQMQQFLVPSPVANGSHDDNNNNSDAVAAAPDVIVLPPQQVADDAPEFVYQSQLEQLRAMGFNDDANIKSELVKEKGSVQRVANRLLQLQ